MSAENWKLEKDLCRCCHNEGSFKKLDEPCKVSGLSEAYTDMLRDCFDIDIAPALGVIRTVTYKICDTCIMRLNNASDFKKQVQRCEDRFRNMYSKIVITVAKPPVEIYVKQENSQTYQEVNTQTWKDDIDNFDKSESDVLVKMEFECNEESDVFNDDDSIVADDQVNGNDNSSIKAEVVVVEESDVFKDSGMTDFVIPKKFTKRSRRSRDVNNVSKVRKVPKTGAERVREYRARIRALENANAARSANYVESNAIQTSSQHNLGHNHVDMRENQSSLLVEVFSRRSTQDHAGDNLDVHQQDLPLISEIPSTNTVQMHSRTQKLAMFRSHSKTPKTAAERSRAYRDRQKALKNATN